MAGGVYAEDSGAIVDDSSPVSRSQRTERLLQAEKAALDHGGMVMRLAGENSEVSCGRCMASVIQVKNLAVLCPPPSA